VSIPQPGNVFGKITPGFVSIDKKISSKGHGNKMSLISTKLLMFDLRGLSLIRVLHNNTRTSVLLRSYYKTDNNVVSSRSIATFFTKKCHGRSSCPVLTRNWDLLTFSTTCRGYSSDNNNSGGGAAAVKEGEIKIKSILSKSFPNAKEIIVEDISGLKVNYCTLLMILHFYNI